MTAKEPLDEMNDAQRWAEESFLASRIAEHRYDLPGRPFSRHERGSRLVFW